MAIRLDYEWDKEWLDGMRWAAFEGADFPEGEEVGYVLWLKQRAFEEGMFTRPHIGWVNKDVGKAVTFIFEEFLPNHVEDGAP